jgi:hypothetical protein
LDLNTGRCYTHAQCGAHNSSAGFSDNRLNGSWRPHDTESRAREIISDDRVREAQRRDIKRLAILSQDYPRINNHVRALKTEAGRVGLQVRLEQCVGRFHRYGQQHDCLMFNFVAVNTREGRVLAKLLERLLEIRSELGTCGW